jgi:hypothetical protein
MTTYGLWRVCGSRAYRGHEPGEEFEGSLPVGAASRAVARGDIELLDEFVPVLPDDHHLPEGWLDK